MPDQLDYRDLLKRYAKHVEMCEGINFLNTVETAYEGGTPRFSPEEAKALGEIAAEIEDEEPETDLETDLNDD